MLTQRQRVEYLPTVDWVLDRTLGKYAAYQLHEREYVGTIDHVDLLEDVVDLLEERGYERNGLSALKYHPETGEPDDGSFRKVDPDAPRWQWHVHLFETEHGVEIYSHNEYRPDLRPIAGESIPEAIARCREHYHPTWDIRVDDPEEATYFLGAACEDVSDLVDGGS